MLRHVKVEQDERKTVFAVQVADLVRVHRGRDGKKAGASQRLLKKSNVGLLDRQQSRCWP